MAPPPKMRYQSLSSTLYLLCVLQILTTVQRQIFDFLGYMWLPILGNFFQIIFCIFCIFGVLQRRLHYVYSYCTWSLLWIGWNLFVLCYYLEVGSLRRTDDLLSFGTGSYSWWLANGFGCRPEYFPNLNGSSSSTASSEYIFDVGEPSAYFPIRPSHVEGCFMDYYNVEALQAVVQLLFALLGVCFSICFAIFFHRAVRPGGAAGAGKGQAIYSIEYSSQVKQNGHSTTATTCLESDLYANTAEDNRPAHMTPRRVKRRSYTRSSARSVGHGNSTNKSFHRNNRRTASLKHLGGNRGSKSGGGSAVNPVTRLLEANNPTATSVPHHRLPVHDSSTSNDERGRAEGQYGQVNPAYQSSQPNSIYSSSMNESSTAAISHHPASAERPPSALTSYSNFHGQRKSIHPPRNNVTNLTQESLLQQQPQHQPQPQQQKLPLVGKNIRIDFHVQEQLQEQQLPPPPIDANSSFDDLPPPPPPLSDTSSNDPSSIEAGATAPSSAVATGQTPIPQQRSNSGRRNEYVNMPVQMNGLNAGGDTSSNNDDNNSYFYIQRHPQQKPAQQQQQQQQQQPPTHHYMLDSNDTQTLRAHDRLLPSNDSGMSSLPNGGVEDDYQEAGHSPPPPALPSKMSAPMRTSSAVPPPGVSKVDSNARYQNSAQLNGYHQSHNGRREASAAGPQSLNATSASGDDYGFVSGRTKGNGAAQPAGAFANSNGSAGNGGNNKNYETDDKWYLHDSMKPIGAQTHGGNCKCYRCQRKLTAI